MKKAVIFDMDGVLVDSQPFHFEMDRAVLAACGHEVPQTVVERYAGMASHNRWAKYKNDLALAQSVDELVAMQTATMMARLDETDFHPISGIPELLAMLRAKGLRLAVASSSSYEFVCNMLDKLGICDAFAQIVSGEDMRNSKPAPDIFLYAAKKLDCLPADCVVVEDSANGVRAAVAAEIDCVAYRNVTSGEQDLTGASRIVTAYAELLADVSWLK